MTAPVPTLTSPSPSGLLVSDPPDLSAPRPGELPPLTGDAYERTYLALAAIFIAALVACNLIFQKFFAVPLPLPGVNYTIVQSVGLLAYPLTFLVTDLLSELYGARRANQVVVAGLFASVFTTLLVEIADAVPSAQFGAGSLAFHDMFAASKFAVFASMMAYLVGQFIDIRLFHFWRRLTRGRHLWLRNNGSTFISQTFDTLVVIGLYAGFNIAGVSWDNALQLIVAGLIFKWIFALLDTPFFYLGVYVMRRRFPRQAAYFDEP